MSVKLIQFVRWLVISTTLMQSTVIGGRETNFRAIFNFGDSNSDTGGLSAAFSSQRNHFFPLSKRTILRWPPHNRFYSHGANFATAGSTVRPQNTTKSQSGYSPISLDVQFQQFRDFKTRSKFVRERGGVFKELLPKEEYFSGALYTFDIGQNDLTAGYKLNFTTEQVKAYIPDVLGQFSRVIKGVHGEGGRTFWIHNTGPLGCLPYMLDRYPMSPAQMDEFGCAKTFNEVAQYFNKRLKESVEKLREELPDAKITYVDVYRVKYRLISHAQKYGFEKGLIACCGHGGKYNFNNRERCGASKRMNGREVVIAKACKDASVRIIWDGIHYTKAANNWIFLQILNGSFSDPPTSLGDTNSRS